MIKFIYILGIMLFYSSLYTFAFDNEIKNVQKNNEYYACPKVDVVNGNYSNGKSDLTQALTFRSLTQNPLNAYVSHTLYSNCSPFVYDPGSKLLIIAHSFLKYGTNEINRIQGLIYYTSNMGSRWDTLSLFDQNDMVMANSSIVINNMGSATSIADIDLTMMGRWSQDITGYSWTYGGMNFGYKDGQVFQVDGSPSPSTNNPGDQYQWFQMPLISSGNNQQSFAAGVLARVQNSTAQHGAYGFLSADLSSQSVVDAKLPSEWSLNQFRISPEVNQSYNANMCMTVDDNNNIFVGLSNIFADDQENRIPSVSISSDGGTSWSTFNRMPNNLFNEYLTQIPNAPYSNIGIYEPYNTKNALCAISVDDYSYFFPVFLTTPDDTIREIHLVEARYHNSSWSLNKVSELNGFIPIIFSRQESDTNNTKFIFDQSSFGYEIQASKTADGQWIIVKYIDQGLDAQGNGKDTVFQAPIPVKMYDNNNVLQDRNLTGLTISDVFIASRNVNETSWRVKNVTDDNTNYCTTYIPNIIPNKDQIPLIYPATAVYANQAEPFNRFPQALRDKYVDFAHSIAFATITNAVSVEDNPENYEFKNINVYPNPVSDNAEFTFQLDNAQNIRIELYNSLGQLVMTPYSNFTSPGLHGVNADVSSLPNGVYFYSLITNERKFTKVMNIVK